VSDLSKPVGEQVSSTGRAPKINTTVPHSARVWNYWLGGKDNFAVDREVGDSVREVYPEIVTVARESRRFLVRVVRFLAGEAGIRQFLDVGHRPAHHRQHP
jgi:S-adenosyl methyltransferase